MLINRKDFERLGGFDEEVTFAEDYFLSKQIRPSKFKITKFKVFTGGRRFKKMGYWWMIKHFILLIRNIC